MLSSLPNVGSDGIFRTMLEIPTPPAKAAAKLGKFSEMNTNMAQVMQNENTADKVKSVGIKLDTIWISIFAAKENSMTRKT